MGQPKVCFCEPTIRMLIKRHGQPHVAQVIELLVSTGNDTELYSATIIAVSDLLIEWPQLLALGGGLYDLFDLFDLSDMRRLAKDANKNNVSKILKAFLYIRLYEVIKGKQLKWVA